jgi:cytochrome P450
VGAAFAQYEMKIVLRVIVGRAELRAARPKPERPRVRNITVTPARGTRVVLERRVETPEPAATLAGAV